MPVAGQKRKLSKYGGGSIKRLRKEGDAYTPPTPKKNKLKYSKEGRALLKEAKKHKHVAKHNGFDPEPQAQPQDITLGKFPSVQVSSAAPQPSVSQPNLNATNGAPKSLHANEDPNESKSYLSHKKQREITATRKSSKPNADAIARAKQIWERLRVKSRVAKEEREELVRELFSIITGHVHDFVFRHDSVRPVQCALKYAKMDQRRQIASELKGSYKQLIESRYGKFLVAKILVEGDDDIRDMVVPEIYGLVRKLINHPEGAWILDDVYRSAANKEQKARMLREWYSPEFAMFDAKDKAFVTAELSEILKESPEKREPIMKYLHEGINRLIQKHQTAFTMLHDAMCQYFINISPGSPEMTDFIKLITGDEAEAELDLLKNLAFTKSGSRVVRLTLANGAARDRRHILKVYKDIYEMMAADQYAHTVILAALDVVDDTRALSDRIFSGLGIGSKTASIEDQAAHVKNLAINPPSHVPLLYPFVGAEKRLLPTATIRLMEEVRQIRATTSKKDPKVRQNELIATLSPVYLQTVTNYASELMTTAFGCLFVGETLLSGVGDKTAALSAVAQACAGDATSPTHVSQFSLDCKLLKLLVHGGRYDRESKKIMPIDPPLEFEKHLLPVIKPHIGDWAVGGGGFVVVALLEKEGDEQWKREIAEVKPLVEHRKKDLKRMARKMDRAAEKGKKKGKKGKKAKKMHAAGEQSAPEDLEEKLTGAAAKLILDLIKEPAET